MEPGTRWEGTVDVEPSGDAAETASLAVSAVQRQVHDD